MTPDDFRRLALAHPDAVEAGHMGKPDFRLHGRIFATLGYPDAGFGMVQLQPEQQEMLMAAEPGLFTPAKGAWGAKGSTLVRLAAVDEATLTSAMAMAWAKAEAKKKGRP